MLASKREVGVIVVPKARRLPRLGGMTGLALIAVKSEVNICFAVATATF